MTFQPISHLKIKFYARRKKRCIKHNQTAPHPGLNPFVEHGVRPTQSPIPGLTVPRHHPLDAIVNPGRQPIFHRR